MRKREVKKANEEPREMNRNVRVCVCVSERENKKLGKRTCVFKRQRGRARATGGRGVERYSVRLGQREKKRGEEGVDGGGGREKERHKVRVRAHISTIESKSEDESEKRRERTRA